MALRRVADVVGLREGEGARTARLFSLIFLLTCGFVLCKTAQQGLFLGAYTRARIPDAFIISALCLAAASFIASALAQRLGPTRLLLALLMLGAVLLGVARVVVERWPGVGPMVTYVIVEVTLGLLLVQAWAVISEALDVRSAKRLLPLIGNAGGLGWALGGFATGPIARGLGTANMLPLAAALFGGCVIVLQLIVHYDLGGRGARGKRGATLWDGVKGGLGYVAKEPLLRAIAVITVACLLIEQILDYQLFAAAQAHYAADADRIAGFMGSFFGVTGCLTLIAPLTVSGRILARFGSAASTAVPPGLVVIVSLMLLATPSFALIVVCRGGYRITKQALASPARAQMQTTIPSIRRAQAGALIKGCLAPAFYGLGGACLKLMPADADYRWLSAPAALLSLLTIIVAWWQLRPAYFEALRKSVHKQQLDLDAARTPLLDSECGRMLRAEAQSEDPDQATFALETLLQADTNVVKPALVQACHHPAPEVRIAAMSGLALRGTLSDRPAVVAALRKASAAPVRIAGLRALATLGLDREAMDMVRADADSDNLRIRALAQACLVQGRCHDCPRLNSQHCSVDCETDEDRAITGLLAMLQSPDPAERTASAWAMGEAEVEHDGLRRAFAELLSEREPDVEVRRTAVRASGALDGRGFMRDILLGLLDHHIAPEAYAAFADAGDDAVPAAERALADMDDIARGRSASALSGGTGPNGDALLARLLDHENRIVRYRAARALVTRRHSEHFTPPPPATVIGAIDRELAIGYGYYAILVGVAQTDGAADFQVAPSHAFFAAEVRIRIRQTETRVLALVALLMDPVLVRTAEYKLHRGTARDASAALELIEHALPTDVRSRVVTFLERRPLRLRLRDVQQALAMTPDAVTDPVAAVAASGDAHLQRCALLCYRDKIQANYPALHQAHLPVLPVAKRFQLLRSIPLFAELSGEALMQVAEIATPIDYPDAHEIFRRGDPGDQVFMIVDGAVAVRRGDTEIARFGEGEFFGELAVLDGEPRSATAVCVGETSLLCIAGPDLDELMERRPQIARKIIRVLTRRLRGSNERLAE